MNFLKLMVSFGFQSSSTPMCKDPTIRKGSTVKVEITRFRASIGDYVGGVEAGRFC